MKTLTTLIALLLLAIQASAATPPNIIIIFIDDMGYADIGPFGATKQKTPALDRMAAEGMKLTSFYAASVCSVSRAQLLTGCYGPRIDVPGVYWPADDDGLNPQETTIAEYLKQQGYATMCVGKWHLGDQPEFLPTSQGFDHYLGIPYSNDMQRPYKGSKVRTTPLIQDKQVIEMLTDEQQESITERYTEAALAFIRTRKDQPFFLYFPHTAIHLPIYPGEAFKGKSDNGGVGDWIEEIDWSTGRILDTLKELGIDDNTLVIFTSDNGPWLVKRKDSGSALPLRGGKGSTWEGGVRVPTIAWWPGKVPSNTSVDAITGTIDLLPTAVALAGGTVPQTPIIDGRDISPILLGKTTESPRNTEYYFSAYQLDAVRQGPWKLALMPQRNSMGQKTDPDAKVAPRLYNLDQEINERTNVAEQHPDVVAHLTQLADAMRDEIGGNSPKSRRPAGKVTDPVSLYPFEPRKQK